MTAGCGGAVVVIGAILVGASVVVVVVVVPFDVLDGNCGATVGKLLGDMDSTVCRAEGTDVVVIVNTGASVLVSFNEFDGDCDTTVGTVLGDSTVFSVAEGTVVNVVDIGAAIIGASVAAGVVVFSLLSTRRSDGDCDVAVGTAVGRKTDHNNEKGVPDGAGLDDGSNEYNTVVEDELALSVVEVFDDDGVVELLLASSPVVVFG